MCEFLSSGDDVCGEGIGVALSKMWEACTGSYIMPGYVGVHSLSGGLVEVSGNFYLLLDIAKPEGCTRHVPHRMFRRSGSS